jgi:hypothetical protein
MKAPNKNAISCSSRYFNVAVVVDGAVPVVSGVAFRKDDQTIHFLFFDQRLQLASSRCSRLGGRLKAIASSIYRFNLTRAMVTIASMSSFAIRDGLCNRRLCGSELLSSHRDKLLPP